MEKLKEYPFSRSQGTEATSILTPKSGGSYCVPMTGMASIEKDNPLIPYTQGIKATVNLTRVVACIDIVNHIPALKITEISLHNAFKNSCVSKSDTQTARLTNAVKPYSSLLEDYLVTPMVVVK